MQQYAVTLSFALSLSTVNERHEANSICVGADFLTCGGSLFYPNEFFVSIRKKTF